MVGIAFATGFTFGPPLGAYFAAIDLREYFPSLISLGIYPYSSAAFFALFLIIIETIYMYYKLPETKNALGSRKSPRIQNINESTLKDPKRAKAIYSISLIHLSFLIFYSGMEFNMTFLTHERFNFTHSQQGMLLGFVGIISSLIQGGYVRRFAHKIVSEKSIIIQGLVCCSISFFLFAIASTLSMLYFAAFFFAFTSGSVVNCLNGLFSIIIKDHDSGKSLGFHRSMGQLGRAIGPLLGAAAYWTLGSRLCFLIYSAALIIILSLASLLLPSKKELQDITINSKKDD